MTNASDLEASADLLRVLGHPVRLTLLTAMIDGEPSVSEIEAATGVGQPLLSQQLGVLRRARLVETRREAKQIFYRLNHDRIREVRTLMDGFAGAVASPRQVTVARQFAHGGSAAMFAQVG